MTPRRSHAVMLMVGLVVASACGDDGPGATDSAASTVSAEVAGTIDLSSATEPVSASGRTTLAGFDETAVEVTTTVGEVLEWCLLLARTDASRRQGLMRVVDLGDYEGMLFEFPDDRDGGFWMRNTPTPLSIAYLDSEGAVVSTVDMEPCADVATCPSYPPAGEYRAAVEVVQGDLEALGLDGPDARLVTAGACPPRD